MRPALFPCLRARMGDWWYYVTVMSFAEINAWVKKVDEIHERKELKTWIQRELTPARLAQIADYLLKQRQHFFNAIVLGIYRGEPKWYPITVENNPALPEIEIGRIVPDAFGFLHLGGKEEIFAVDGQHRVEGIRAALKRTAGHGLAKDQQTVLFVAHRETEDGRVRTRRMFSTLNKYARPVSKGEIVALSEDDTFAVVARKVIDEYPHLRIEFVPLTKTANIPSGEKKAITTVLGLYEVIKALCVTRHSREKKRLEIGPPIEAEVDSLYEQVVAFWDLLRQFVVEIKKVTDSKPSEELAARYRNDQGGHLLFRPAGMKAFAMAVRILLDRKVAMREAIAILSKTSLYLHERPWPGILWNSYAHKMINKNGTLCYNMLLYMSRMPLDPVRYPLLQEYRKALDDEDASLRKVPRVHG
jgi:DNA sulfur modification protein DndB